MLQLSGARFDNNNCCLFQVLVNHLYNPAIAHKAGPPGKLENSGNLRGYGGSGLGLRRLAILFARSRASIPSCLQRFKTRQSAEIHFQMCRKNVEGKPGLANDKVEGWGGIAVVRGK